MEAPTYLEMFGNAHETIPTDALNPMLKPTAPHAKILAITARNYQLEAALDKLAAQFEPKDLIPNQAVKAANNPEESENHK